MSRKCLWGVEYCVPDSGRRVLINSCFNLLQLEQKIDSPQGATMQDEFTIFFYLGVFDVIILITLDWYQWIKLIHSRKKQEVIIWCHGHFKCYCFNIVLIK
jgi:hypothetical protein